MNQCFKIENSKYCPDFNGYYTMKRTNLNDTTSFDNAIKKYVENKDSYKIYLSEKFKCSVEKLPDFRYSHSFICSSFAVIPNVDNGPKLCKEQIDKDKNVNKIPFCYYSCTAAVESIGEILTNPDYECSWKEYSNYFNSLKTNCNSWYNNIKDDNLSDNCFIGTKEEQQFCGYSNEDDKKNYCQQKKHLKDSCCEESNKITTIIFIFIVIISACMTIFLYIYKKKNSNLFNKYKRHVNFDFVEGSTKLPYEGEEEGGETSYTVKSTENNLLYVFHEYIPKINDEIQLNVGDIVKVSKIFDDGWAYGTNISTDCEGALPLACCTEYRTSISSMLSFSIPTRPVNKRDSSLYIG
ncbi:hypothetical protein BCR32DRAFT_288986 [Anaeromyces robustus]|uniref:SH3 domain-containing protein n=1 Tax=Anaeromyces robustus TaxID=1754192 RepID=A0A1Y1XQ48_9FUNG|nr:hypothetical protein BCR32DRAFT_288986 [Anaeromyces robustus]|eukprot:ORX87867.1 hypothetical protein BCR32DRAFT_288986 [Anaeromyces robustus]